MGRARRRAEARGRARGDGGRGDGRRVDRAHRARDARPGAAAAGDGVRAHVIVDCGFRIADWKGGRRIRNSQSAIRNYLLRTPMQHLYVHVPFCARRCSYCDFSIAVRKRIPAGEYVDAVLKELELVRAADPGATPRGALETLYLGGGTPSLLPPDALATLVT